MKEEKGAENVFKGCLKFSNTVKDIYLQTQKGINPPKKADSKNNQTVTKLLKIKNKEKILSTTEKMKTSPKRKQQLE
jgi:hypothetical protein